eukprot:4970813-Amphidinium_carterae.1
MLRTQRMASIASEGLYNGESIQLFRRKDPAKNDEIILASTRRALAKKAEEARKPKHHVRQLKASVQAGVLCKSHVLASQNHRHPQRNSRRAIQSSRAARYHSITRPTAGLRESGCM